MKEPGGTGERGIASMATRPEPEAHLKVPSRVFQLSQEETAVFDFFLGGLGFIKLRTPLYNYRVSALKRPHPNYRI